MPKDTKNLRPSAKKYGEFKNSLPVNNTIVCQGNTVTADYLFQQASKLTGTNDQLQVILELLSLQGL